MTRHTLRSDADGGLDTAGFFVLRTPLLPADILDDAPQRAVSLNAAALSDAALSDGPPSPQLEERLRAARAQTRQWLETLLQRPEVMEALRLASPSLLDGLEIWRRAPDSKKGRRAEAALLRYVQRMASRPTPFGLFAGTSVGQIESSQDAASADRLELPPLASYQRHTRLDNDVLFDLGEQLQRAPEVREGLVLRPNSSLHRKGETWRYAEAQRRGSKRIFQLLSADASPALDAVLEAARDGMALPTLQDLLVQWGEGDVTADEAAEFIHQLIDSEILSAELMPNVTGLPPVADMIRRLRGAGGAAKDSANALIAVQRRLAVLDDQGLAPRAGDDDDYATALRDLQTASGQTTADGEDDGAEPVDPRRQIQVELSKPGGDLHLGPKVAAALCRGVEALARLRPPMDDGLQEFRQQFSERYGDGRLVPLNDVLDVDLGLGFPVGAGRRKDASPLVAGLPVGGVGGGTPTLPWGARERLLADRLQRAVAAGEVAIQLTDDDLRALPQSKDPLPDSLQVMASLAATDVEAVERGDFQLLMQGFHGPSGARLLGRFCHTDPELQRHVQRLIDDEEALQPEAAFAEVVHLPQGRLGNVTWRPRLRRHEIPFLGRGSAEGDDRIDLDDLHVTVSQGVIRLWSKRLGKEVIPRLTNAHNYLHGQLPVYQFLCALQKQGLTGNAVFSWGALQHNPFLPRVVYGQLVLCRASWRVDHDDLKTFDTGTDATRFVALQRWRRRRGVPRHVILQDADNELRVDLDDPAVVDAFLATVRGRANCRLVEVFPEPGDEPVRGPEGAFRHELVVPLRRHREPSPAWTPAVCGAVPRQFAPGSEWLYVKIYTDPGTADELLQQVVLPTVRGMQQANAVERWFFLRYSDPERHLRIRLQGDPAALLSQVLPALTRRLQPFLDSGRVQRVQLDTYERELERYGGDHAIAAAEALFHADSEVTATLISLAGDDADKRWQLTLLGLDRLVQDLGLSADAQGELWRHLADGFRREFGDGKTLKKFLSQRLRQHRKPLERLLDPSARAQGPMAAADRILDRRRATAEAMGRLAQRLEENDQLTLSWQRIASSFAHMFVNRMMRAEGRAHEVVLYDLLDRLHRSRQARLRSAARRQQGAVA